MGGMHTWIWGVTYPDFMDALAPMAAQPTEMSSRNWMMRRLIIDAIRNDPDWKGGDYTEQPQGASASPTSSTASPPTAARSPTRSRRPPARRADKLLDQRLAAPFNADANDFLYQWDSSRDYNPSPGLERIQAALLAINSADDERNPPETGIMDRELKRVKNGKLLLIPASEDTRGHGTTGMAKFWKAELQQFLATVPKRAM